MSLIKKWFGTKKPTASVAKDRLKIILAHERSTLDSNRPDFLNDLQRDLVEVISKYIQIDINDIKVNLEQQDNLEVLEVKIEMPEVEKKAG
ncbi:cell division topological specificity factor MinE [Lampropedia hyalina DSM 16112]|jgi:cell division topological specificity factor|uniref:Cell division topological specificity factor n=1 Tax=Lampropedia hyalina DSM 16112 TaxID=1122156 RepID=A0A1M4VT62_9BURK|nr:cell division topological specificity factor MinE [Lampropedia hyalina]SHE72311.1 cell division topological specificity factor MinE [Lampropedia hyalina DSM 16112]